MIFKQVLSAILHIAKGLRYNVNKPNLPLDEWKFKESTHWYTFLM